MPRRAVLAVLCLGLFTCAPHASIVLDPPAAAVGQVEQVFFGTTRSFDASVGDFGPLRSSRESFGRMDVSIPPRRKTGTIGLPGAGRPDPQRDFLTTSFETFASDAGFKRSLGEAIRRSPTAKGEVVVFIHGYANTFGDAAYRLAQLAHDLDAPAVQVLYSWPSAGKPLRYAFDRDSVLFAREGLEKLLEAVADAGASRILLVGHSLGAELTMEVLRQMELDGNRKVKSRLSGVVLISPDIDTQLFRRQAKEAGTLPQPFLIFVSGRDQVLRLSAALTGRSSRLGNIKELDKIAELPVTVVNVSAFSTGGGHFTTGNSPTLLAMLARSDNLLRNVTFDGQSETMLTDIAHTLENASEVVLSPPN